MKQLCTFYSRCLKMARFLSYHTLHFSSTSFCFTWTRIISSPTWQISQNGITYSFSRPKNPQNAPGPGTMIAVIHPLFISKSTSPTNPSLLQSSALITSFCFKSEIRKTHRTCLFCYILCVFSLVLFDYRDDSVVSHTESVSVVS